MNHLKILVLAALVVSAAAIAGVSPAMAESTAFCASDPGTGPEEVCPEGKLLSHVHGTTVEELPAVILTTVYNIQCSALYLADTVEELASPLVLEGKFSYSNCSNECSVKEENGPSKIKALKLGHDKADAELEMLLTIACTGINCRYVAEWMKGLFKGALLPFTGKEGGFSEAKWNKEGGLLCPSNASLDLLILSLELFHVTK